MLLGFLPRYVAHLGRAENHDSTLLCKFLGLFSIRIFFQTIYFTVMENVMPTGKGEVELEYDLKGSFVARNAKKPARGKLARRKSAAHFSTSNTMHFTKFYK